MSEEYVVQYCAPTLAGIKTGSLFSGFFKSREVMNREIRAYNKILRKKGLRLIPLSYRGNRVLLYLYRPDQLAEDLNDQEAKRLLQEAGYQQGSAQELLMELIRRVNSQEKFPHEIGLFLSYPPEDVRGYIENKAQKYQLVGTWKVYGDKEKARKRFREYQQCTSIYCENCRSGKGLEQLAVGC